jgi:hypothetical protein
LNHDNEGYSVQQTSDGGYVVAGYIGTTQKNVYVLRFNSSGGLMSPWHYGGTKDDEARSIQQTSDGGYIITGYTKSYGDSTYGDVYLIKTDSLGNEMWAKTFSGSHADRGESVQQTSDGGYIIAGYTNGQTSNSDVWLIKTDSSGNEMWNKTFGGPETEYGFSVQQTSDGGYIIVGSTSSYGSGLLDVYLIKTDSSGNEVWSETFGGSGNDAGRSVQQTSDGGYIIAGYIDHGSNNYDIWLIKVTV